MKFCRIGKAGAEVPAVVDQDGAIRSLADALPDLDATSLPDLRDLRDRVDIAALPVLDEGRFGPCVAPGGRVLCIGLNYADHAKESGLPIPEEPVVFMKACRPTGPNDDIAIPPGAAKVDWEAELAVVIGRACYRITEDQVSEHIAGYCIMNDVSERAYQHERGGQWVKGKSLPGFAPLGPWLVTADEIDPGSLDVWLEVDGERYQDGSTADLIFSVPRIISYLSHFMTLEPGDVISTGTPAGVGAGLSPQVFLRAGQTVRLGISGLGEQSQNFV